MKFILHLLLLLSVSALFGQTNSKTEYFRHLRYNHISPFVEIVGIHPIGEATARNTSHYIFKYDASDRLVEVVNNHYHTEKRHPLASIGAYRVKIEHMDGKEIRMFYDPNGIRVSNDRGVYKEIYHYDGDQRKSKLQFFDLDNNPMESSWEIAEYQWSRNNDFVIEQRFDLNNKAVNVSPYFEFGVTGMRMDTNGLANGVYNLNDNLEVTNNAIGVASYRDTYDAAGNHIEYSYYDSDDELILNQWNFATGKKSYDELGNNIQLEQLDEKGEVIRSRPVYSNVTIALSPAASSQDSSDIRRQSLGYLKALQELDTILMDEVMNDSLNKVTIGYNRTIKKEIATATTRDQMMAFAKDWNKSNTKFPVPPNNEVTILSIYNRIASVRLVSDNWVEYLHLIKLNGKWDIVNLIWQHKDVNRYPK